MALSEYEQTKIILSYEKDYGSLVMAYNKLCKLKDTAALNILRMKAEGMRKEISPYKNHFNDTNFEVVALIASSIDNFINFQFSIEVQHAVKIEEESQAA